MILITGGSASGKSAYAEERICKIRQETGLPMYYLATMRVYDSDGRARVQRHRAMRAGKGFWTIEQPDNIIRCLAKTRNTPAIALLECVSNLTANEMFQETAIRPENEVVEKITEQIRQLDERFAALVVVTNNIFEDGMDYPAQTRAYAGALGKINRNLAAAAQETWEVVAGIPLRLK